MYTGCCGDADCGSRDPFPECFRDFCLFTPTYSSLFSSICFHFRQPYSLLAWCAGLEGMLCKAGLAAEEGRYGATGI